MSPATFHRQCKELTSFTPIQYQKRLRLYEAQQFLMRGDGDVNSAAFAVGYVSPQQVSLKYPTIARQLTISISANTARHWPA